jgi:hypothetical protein
MEKEFVPYEQALALKELGFDEYCFGYYGVQFEFVLDKMKNTSSNYSRRGLISAPLYQQVFEFFRDKHGFHSYIEVYSDDTFDYTIISKIFTETNDYGDGPFLTFYEAQLACLNQLIKLVKNKL